MSRRLANAQLQKFAVPGVALFCFTNEHHMVIDADFERSRAAYKESLCRCTRKSQGLRVDLWHAARFLSSRFSVAIISLICITDRDRAARAMLTAFRFLPSDWGRA